MITSSDASFLSLPREILFQSVSGQSGFLNTRSAIRAFTVSYLPLSLVSKPLKEKIDICWLDCLGLLWNDWKKASEWRDLSKEEFVKQLFFCSNLIVNWIDGTPKVTKRTYKEMDEKELVLKFDDPYQGVAYKMAKWHHPILFSESPGENTSHDSYYFDCNKTFAIHVNEGGFGSAVFYSFEDMRQIGKVEGTTQIRVMPHCDLKPLLFEKTACIFTAKFHEPINGFDHFVMDIYDVLTSSIEHVNQIELPFYVVTAHAVKDQFVFFCHRDKSYMLAAVSGDGFVYSAPFASLCRSSKFVEMQGQLFFLSLVKCTLSIQVVEITSDGIHLQSIEIPGIEELVLHTDIFEASSYLDKLFVISYDSDHKPMLFVIDFITMQFKTISLLEFKWLNHGMTIVSSRLGVVQVFIPDRYNPSTLTIDYTSKKNPLNKHDTKT